MVFECEVHTDVKNVLTSVLRTSSPFLIILKTLLTFCELHKTLSWVFWHLGRKPSKGNAWEFWLTTSVITHFLKWACVIWTNVLEVSSDQQSTVGLETRSSVRSWSVSKTDRTRSGRWNNEIHSDFHFCTAGRLILKSYPVLDKIWPG